jgi:cysteine desulfurase/selenocysteine lyase
MHPQPDFSLLRDDFPMLKSTMHGKPLIYLDSAATAQKPQIVIDTITDFYQNHYGTVHRAVYELSAFATKNYESTRHKVKALLNAANAEEIIFTRGTTDAINIVAYSFGKAFIQPGDEIIITEMEHHSNIVPWQIMCEERGALLKVVPINERGELKLDVFESLLNKKTKLVALAHVANSTGTINPIEQIINMAHAFNAKVLIDGAQSVPHMPVDVQDLDADFYVFSGHKAYGPTGVGILYGKKTLLDQMPPYQGGGDMIETVTFAKTTYNVLPLKFEAGTPLIAEVLGLGAAIDYITTIGLSSIYAWENELRDYATQQITEIGGLRIIGTATEKCALISFAVDKVHPLDIGTMLDLRGIAVRTGHLCAQPTMQRFSISATTRASFAFYNTKEEIDIFIAALQDIISTLQHF